MKIDVYLRTEVVKIYTLRRLFAIAFLSPILKFCLLLTLGATFHANAQAPFKVEEIAWRQIKSLQGIVVGSSKHDEPMLRIFFDPNCPHCATLWRLSVSETYWPNGPVVWVPVPYLKPSSLGKATALLRSRDSYKLAANFEEFDHAVKQGAIQPVVPSSTERNKLGRAKSVWHQLGAGTPMLVWRSKSTGEVMGFLGLPSRKKLEELLRDVSSGRLEAFR